MSGSRIALVSQHDDTDLFTDGPLLFEAFAQRGHHAEVAPWGAACDWAAFDAVIVRATYDYIDRPDEFFAWADRVERVTRLANPAATLRWNGDKSYLRDLAAGGIATIPTAWVGPHDTTTAHLDHDEIVVKPTTSAGSRLAARYRRNEHDAARRHLEQLSELGLSAMVQPYVAAVDDVGETGVYVFGGAVSHAIQKSAALLAGAPPAEDFAAGFAQVIEPQPLDDNLTSFALAVIGALPPDLPQPLYARIDTVRDAHGTLLLLELELIEPFLFLETSLGAADRYVDAALQWIARPPNGYKSQPWDEEA
ncbi:MAG TPA: hypothetical protein VNB24_05220 [Acidimicrobiales bacterium]|nr:hypothetical protein [Acidimicrobiales bacterium]